MTDQERYLFDLQGFLVIPNALSVAQVAALNGLLDQHIEGEMAPEASTHRFGDLLTWGQPYVDLIDNPRVESHLTEILGEQFRIDHLYLDVIRSGLSPIGATLHGGGTPFHRVNFYDFRNGRMYSGLFVVAYNLADVGPEDGGFACVPGSHKSNYPFPAEWRDLTDRQPFVERNHRAGRHRRDCSPRPSPTARSPGPARTSAAPCSPSTTTTAVPGAAPTRCPTVWR